MSYIGLGSRLALSATDTTGLNDGNATNAFPVNVLGAKVPYYEVYSITVRFVPVLSTITAYIGTRVRTSALLAGNAEWDPSQPILLTYSDELYLCWDIAEPDPPIEATIWLRYDPAIQPQGALS